MIKIFTYIIVGLTLWSCTETKSKPQNLIAEDKMIDILYDMNMFQAIRNNDYRLYESHNINPEHYIYKKYNIDSLQFVQSNKYYASNMEEYDKILSAVMDRIKIEKEKVELHRPKLDTTKLPEKKLIRSLPSKRQQ
ncbi:MAG: DUF4296 domain-containing protein [Flavobacteriaceae bacterium]